ncbi:uncharacterized protein [Diadema setosum]|uniref:uncharacterized protein isoform X2 n=1 Tax=Diadema setosum TaxID=31175 RepID=UPI003B3BABA6
MAACAVHIPRKLFRAQVRKEKRKKRRQAAAQMRDAEKGDKNADETEEEQGVSGVEGDGSIQTEQARLEAHAAWLERENHAQMEFAEKRQTEEAKKEKELAERKRIQDEWEERQRREREQEEKEKEKKDLELENVLKQLDVELGNEKGSPQEWRNPDAPPSQPNPAHGQANKPEKRNEVCSFFAKTGACRFRDRCSRTHPPTESSPTLVFFGMYTNFGLGSDFRDEYDADVGLECDEESAYVNFREFYDDVLPEFRECGNVVQLKVCRNWEPHLKGNVYVQFSKEEEAARAMEVFSGRFYGGQQLAPQYCAVTKWKPAICGLFHRNRCPKGKHCNFLHVFQNPSREFSEADQDYPPRTPHRHGNDKWRELNSYTRRRRSRSRSRSRYDRWRRSRRRSRSRSRSRGRQSRSRSRDRRSRSRSKGRRSRSRSRDRSVRRHSRRSRSVERRGNRSRSRSRSRSKSRSRSRSKSRERKGRSGSRRVQHHKRSRSRSRDRESRHQQSHGKEYKDNHGRSRERRPQSKEYTEEKDRVRETKRDRSRSRSVEQEPDRSQNSRGRSTREYKQTQYRHEVRSGSSSPETNEKAINGKLGRCEGKWDVMYKKKKYPHHGNSYHDDEEEEKDEISSGDGLQVKETSQDKLTVCSPEFSTNKELAFHVESPSNNVKNQQKCLKRSESNHDETKDPKTLRPSKKEKEKRKSKKSSRSKRRHDPWERKRRRQEFIYSENESLQSDEEREKMSVDAAEMIQKELELRERIKQRQKNQMTVADDDHVSNLPEVAPVETIHASGKDGSVVTNEDDDEKEEERLRLAAMKSLCVASKLIEER